VARRRDYTPRVRRIVGLAVATVGVFAVAVLVGALAGYLVRSVDGSQEEGEQATPRAPPSVPAESRTVEKAVPAATPVHLRPRKNNYGYDHSQAPSNSDSHGYS
jgi:hypothetical protein